MGLGGGGGGGWYIVISICKNTQVYLSNSIVLF